MLVLSRQRDQTIMIGDDIEITVVDIRGEKVRLGINAPAHIPVHRKEVYAGQEEEAPGSAPERQRAVMSLNRSSGAVRGVSLPYRKFRPAPCLAAAQAKASCSAGKCTTSARASTQPVS